MAEYQKINTLFKRDGNNIIILDEYSKPEFKYLENLEFECTEKIDGTNIRIELDRVTEYEWKMEFKGRTDKANIPMNLEKRLHYLFDNVDWNVVFSAPNNVEIGTHITIYGEGYGRKIQKVGSSYMHDDNNFILFDVKVGNWWLSRDACQGIAYIIGIDVVPLIGMMTIPEAIEYVRTGFNSIISEDRELKAEGLVLKTPYGLQFRNGERIILKIKTCDFKKYKAKYGNDLHPKNRPINTKYNVF